MHGQFAQKGVDLEYIVIDGASTDGTVDIVRKAKDAVRGCACLSAGEEPFIAASA